MGCTSAASAYREGVTRLPRRTASPREGRLRGLSRVKGDLRPVLRGRGGGNAALLPGAADTLHAPRTEVLGLGIVPVG